MDLSDSRRWRLTFFCLFSLTCVVSFAVYAVQYKSTVTNELYQVFEIGKTYANVLRAYTQRATSQVKPTSEKMSAKDVRRPTTRIGSLRVSVTSWHRVEHHSDTVSQSSVHLHSGMAHRHTVIDVDRGYIRVQQAPADVWHTPLKTFSWCLFRLRLRLISCMAIS